MFHLSYLVLFIWIFAFSLAVFLAWSSLQQFPVVVEREQQEHADSSQTFSP